MGLFTTMSARSLIAATPTTVFELGEAAPGTGVSRGRCSDATVEKEGGDIDRGRWGVVDKGEGEA